MFGVQHRQIKLGLLAGSELSNLNAKCDWGYTKDAVEGMSCVMQHDTPETFVLATGRHEAVRDLVTSACKQIDVHLRRNGAVGSF